MSAAMHSVPISRSRSVIMREAWAFARRRAAKHGGAARNYLGSAMRRCWADAKSRHARTAAMCEAVYDEVARIRAAALARREQAA